MFKNKHVIVAMLVAPLLAILAWFAVGEFAGEKPKAAVAGQTYPLVEQSNCRYDSGACDLENEDMRLRVTLVQTGSRYHLQLSSSYDLEGVLMAISVGGIDGRPAAMEASDAEGKLWRLPLGELPRDDSRLRVAARASGSNYYGDISTTFLERYRSGSP